ncbi:MAG: membrane protein insertase YidC [Bacteroidota bacterium]
MDKQTTLAFILMGIILVVWLYFNSPEPQPQLPDTTDTTVVSEKPEQDKDTIAETAKADQTVKSDKSQTEETTEQSTNVFAVTEKEGQIITIETDLSKIEMTSKGGKIRKIYLKNYNTWYYRDKGEDDFYNTHVQLINQTNGGDLDLIFVTHEGQLVNTSKLDFESSTDNHYYKLSDNDSLTLTYTFAVEEGKEIKKHFVFYGNDYQSRFNVEMINMNKIISGLRYDVEWSNGLNFLEENSVDEATYANSSAFSGEEQLVLDADTDGEKFEKDINGKVDWISIKSKYFAMILTPENPYSEGGAGFEGIFKEIPGLGQREYYKASLKIPFKNLNHQQDNFYLYLGPVDYHVLKSYDNNYDAIFDFGSFFGLKIITRPISEYILLPLFTFLHKFVPNYGVVIILFSIIIKIALYPLTRQSYLSMRKMQKLQPKISELKEKFKGDQQRIQKETMGLYKTYGVNPAGGCLPMVLQMPILFALFAFFRVAIEIRHQPFLWINDLASPDYVYNLGFAIPLVGVDKITILAPLLGITMFFQQKMTVKDPSQKAMVYMMPIMMTFLFMGFSSGLNLYYFMFNLLSIGQQYYINHKKGDDDLQPVKSKGKQGGGFMQRMMEAAEKQKQSQNQAAKKKRKF